MTLLFKTVGVSLLLTMGLVDVHASNAAFYVLPLYLVRTWLMNATGSLTKSVLNDYVPKRSRAKWKYVGG